MHEGDASWATGHLGLYDTIDDFVVGWLTPDHARSYPHFRPQYEFLCDVEGHLLVDFVGRHERIAQDYALVAERLGVTRALQRNNPGPAAPRSAPGLSREALAIVANVYGRDFEIFEYRL